jgi:hypothetical protein
MHDAKPNGKAQPRLHRRVVKAPDASADRSGLTAIRGLFQGRRRKPLSIDEMNAAIAEMGSMSERGR